MTAYGETSISVVDSTTLAMRRRLKTTHAQSFALIISILPLGCAPPAPEGLVPAHGIFVWNTGEPIEGLPGIARFHPFDPEYPTLETSPESSTKEIVAKLNDDGSFRLTTGILSGGKSHRFDGVEPGQYKVMLFLQSDHGTPRINPDYQHPVRTPLLIEITDSDRNSLELTVERNLNGWQP